MFGLLNCDGETRKGCQVAVKLVLSQSYVDAVNLISQYCITYICLACTMLMWMTNWLTVWRNVMDGREKDSRDKADQGIVRLDGDEAVSICRKIS